MSFLEEADLEVLESVSDVPLIMEPRTGAPPNVESPESLHKGNKTHAKIGF